MLGHSTQDSAFNADADTDIPNSPNGNCPISFFEPFFSYIHKIQSPDTMNHLGVKSRSNNKLNFKNDSFNNTNNIP